MKKYKTYLFPVLGMLSVNAMVRHHGSPDMKMGTMCFCKVGDKIQDGDNPPVVVSDISPGYNGFLLRAFKIKNDGELYKNDSEIWSYNDDWNKWSVIK